MDKFIKSQLDGILLSRQIIAKEANNIDLRISAIFGYCEGMESGIQYSLQNDMQSPVPNIQLNQESNGYQEIISKPTSTEKPVENIINEVKEMIIELKIKGSVRERKNGLIEYRSKALGSIYGHTKEEIEQKLTKALKEIKCKNRDKGSETTKKTPLLSEFFNADYVPYKEKQDIAQKTIKGYYDSFKNITKYKFDKPLTKYKAKEIEDFLYSIPHSRTRQIVQGLLNNMFKRAITVGLIKNNPCDSIERVSHTQEQGTAFSFEEQNIFFDNLFKTDKLTYQQKCYFILVYLTGTRREEAIKIRACDVDFKNKVIEIYGTKTEKSRRQIPLSPLVEKLLLSMNIKKGKYFNWTEGYAERLFRKAWKKEKGHKLHDLRHTYGTIKISVEKIDVKTVSVYMGHSTVNTTLSIYTHPEQLDKRTFFRGDLTDDEKLCIYREKYADVIKKIDDFLS